MHAGSIYVYFTVSSVMRKTQEEKRKKKKCADRAPYFKGQLEKLMGFAARSLGLAIDPPIYLLVDRLRLHHHFLNTHPAFLVPPLINSVFRAVGKGGQGGD